jgi:hypothetical protein
MGRGGVSHDQAGMQAYMIHIQNFTRAEGKKELQILSTVNNRLKKALSI